LILLRESGKSFEHGRRGFLFSAHNWTAQPADVLAEWSPVLEDPLQAAARLRAKPRSPKLVWNFLVILEKALQLTGSLRGEFSSNATLLQNAPA